MVVKELVEGIIAPITTNNTSYPVFLKKWQHLLYKAMDIPELSVEDEDAWPYLGNMLIAYLIVRDMVYSAATATVLASSTTDGQSPAGSIKKIETGPVNVERFDGAVSASKLYADIMGKDGLWEDIQLQICGLAARFSLHISGCKNRPRVAMKVIRGSDYSYEAQYPITPASIPKT